MVHVCGSSLFPLGGDIKDVGVEHDEDNTIIIQRLSIHRTSTKVELLGYVSNPMCIYLDLADKYMIIFIRFNGS